MNIHDPSLIRRQPDELYFQLVTANKISYATTLLTERSWMGVGSMLPDDSVIDLEGRDGLWVIFPVLLREEAKINRIHNR